MVFQNQIESDLTFLFIDKSSSHFFKYHIKNGSHLSYVNCTSYKLLPPQCKQEHERLELKLISKRSKIIKKYIIFRHIFREVHQSI